MPPINRADNGGAWITPERRQAIYERDNFKCLYCDDLVEFKNRTIDHIKPQTSGGKHNSDNLGLCCRSCNSIKGRKTIRQFFKWLRFHGFDTNKIYKRIRRRTRRKLNKKFRI